MGTLVQEAVANTGNGGTDRPAGAWSGPTLASTTSSNRAVLTVEMDGAQVAAPTVSDTGTTWTLKLADTGVRQAIYVSAPLTGAALAPVVTTDTASNIAAVLSEWSGLSGSIGATAVDSSMNTVKGKSLTVSVAATSTVIFCGSNNYGATGMVPAGAVLVGVTSTGGLTATLARITTGYDNPGVAGNVTVGWSGESGYQPEAMLVAEFTAATGSGGSVAVASSVAASLAGGKVASAAFAVTTSSVPAAAGSKVGVRAFDTTTGTAAAAAGTKATSGSFTLAGRATANLLSGNVVTGVLDVAAHVGAAFAGAKRATGALSLSVGSTVNVAARKLTSGALDVTTRPAPIFAASRSVAGAFRTVWQAVVALVTGSTTKSTSTFQIGSPVEQFSVGDPTSRYSINGAPTDRYRIDPP